MKWQKEGRIFVPENLGGWRNSTFMTPTPYLLNPETIRIYGGFRDALGVSRIGYIDVKASNPKEIIQISEKPVLDIGENGMFDDNGVILGALVQNKPNELYMYYVGFQLVQKVKFLAFSGLAISKDGGENFERIAPTPILDRVGNEKYMRCIHSVIKEDNIFKIWYSTGHKWEYINHIPYPQYEIKYITSSDGIQMPFGEGSMALSCINDEYRIGRPTVFGKAGDYHMFYTTDTLQKVYSCGYAQSSNGIDWIRRNDLFDLPPSITGWDSEMTCYPIPLTTAYGTYLFYNGNGMGLSGVGYARLIE